MMDEARTPGIVNVYSARPDGSTTVTIGLSGVAAAESRALAIDADVQRAELAALLDLEETPGIYELAYQSRLSPVRPDELESHVQWRDGVGVLPGVRHRENADELTEHFMSALLSCASATFDWVFIDSGQRRELNRAPAGGRAAHVFVLCPTPLGLSAFDKMIRELEAEDTDWRAGLVVLNKVSKRSFRGVDTFIEQRYGLRVVGALPWAPEFWASVEESHSIRSLTVTGLHGSRFKHAYGAEAQATRYALGLAFLNIAAALQRTPVAVEA
jgi:MinD-like ATPase involved in chromosome partitioning or flagellar assembly